MGTTSSTSKSKTKGGDPAGAKAASGSSSAARAAKRAAMAQPTLKNVRKVQDIYDMKSVLGTGGYAVVWSAVHKATKEEYAIKVMKATASASPKDDEVTVDEIRNEIEVMKKLEHPNIIYVKEYFVQSGKFYIVMSCLRGGELLDALLDLGNYTEEDAKCIAKQLLDALSYMHLNNVTHRDIKLENLLLARPNDISSVVIADFGLARNSVNARQVRTESHRDRVADARTLAPAPAPSPRTRSSPPLTLRSLFSVAGFFHAVRNAFVRRAGDSAGQAVHPRGGRVVDGGDFVHAAHRVLPVC